MTMKSDHRLLPNEVSAEVEIVEIPITKVSVSEDRAEILRTAHVSWKKGRHALFVTNITIFAYDESLRSSLQGAAAPTIGNSRLLRWYVAPQSDHSQKEQIFLEKLDSLSNQFYTMIDSDTLAKHQANALHKAFAAAGESILRQICHHNAQPEVYQERINHLFDRYAELLQKSKDWRFSFRDLIEEIQILVREADEDPGVIRKLAGVLLNYEAQEAGEGLLKISYEVPCAQWRPLHEAHLGETTAQGEKVTLITHGVVWQNAGEDWKDVELTLSTARPSLGLEMQLPKQDFLKLRPKTEEERRQVRVALRDQLIQDTGLSEEQSPAVPDDGGQTQIYSPQGKVTIPADGRPYFVELSRLESDCSSSLVASPELSDRVFLRSELKAQNKPLLAGQIKLYRQGGYVGQGFLNFVGPAEPFHLYWGSEDFIQLVRWLDEHAEKGGMLTKPKKFFTVNVLARNLKNETVKFLLQERIPVSELEQVVINIDQLPRNVKPDKDGFVKVEVSLQPQSEQKFVFKYHYVMDKNVVM
ncbi:mucoidy inhibitor MuiA family protein [candidate division CSSED10-310 bacterium]|uniref:Mucoidy inhibitor MuiA family protein n=1 Tax=candidate division CSSED10-310 bacterium TaxID=2855610 RepID=A0ABV6Z303_UNCC1